MELKVEAVGKRYRGGVQALVDFTLTLGPGVLGLLGPNGAGKSTLMRILATVTRPTAGRVLWDGADVARQPDMLRDLLGYLPQDFGVYPNLTALEFLEYVAAMKGLEARPARARIAALLELVNLTDQARRPLGGYSGGMRQRIGIAQALLNDPRLLIVDEPTAGLDPEERVRFRNLLAELSGERIVILSTHIVSDVEASATSIALIASGRLLAHGAPETLLSAVDGRVWESLIPAGDFASIKARVLISGTSRRREGVLIRTVGAEAPVAGARQVVPTLEDAYLHALAEHRAAPAPAASPAPPAASPAAPGGSPAAPGA
ncbi:MAG TPA: ABC transporter ATP-binding protein [Patescibacteria group bacterium]|nr:ABC transporter ATP-binding protein [Patescibacteria group bacterium]